MGGKKKSRGGNRGGEKRGEKRRERGGRGKKGRERSSSFVLERKMSMPMGIPLLTHSNPRLTKILPNQTFWLCPCQ